MAKGKTPTRIHVFMGGFPFFGSREDRLWEDGHLCKNAQKEAGWSDAYMSESKGLYQKLPRCEDCTSELERRGELREQWYADGNVDRPGKAKAKAEAKPKKLGIYTKRTPVRTRDDSPLYLRTYLGI